MANTAFSTIGLTKLVDVEALLKAVNTAAAVNQLLLAGVERVAFRANFHTDALLCGSSLDCVSTCTGDCGSLVFGMDAFSH